MYSELEKISAGVLPSSWEPLAVWEPLHDTSILAIDEDAGAANNSR